VPRQAQAINSPFHDNQPVFGRKKNGKTDAAPNKTSEKPYVLLDESRDT
jgi:hypothetical protein